MYDSESIVFRKATASLLLALGPSSTAIQTTLFSILKAALLAAK